MTQTADKTTARPLWRRIARWLAVAVAAVVALTGLALCLVVWVFTPQRLTPMVEQYAGEYFEADVTVSRVELTVWRTFPHIRLDVDSLTIVSRTLRDLPSTQRDSLPAYADTLMRIESMTGGINLAKILIGTVALHDVEIVRPTINLVLATPDAANYMIVPPSDDDTPPGSIPDITINRFAIDGDARIRYMSLPDTTDVELTLSLSGLTDSHGSTPYNVAVRGATSLSMGGMPILADLRIGLDGQIHWTARNPESVSLTGFDIALDSIHAAMDADIFMLDPMTIDKASISIAPTPVMQLLKYIPEEYRSELDGLDTDLTVGADITLTAPYSPMYGLMPSARVSITIPDGTLSYQGYHLDRIGSDISADINGQYPDSSTVDIRRLDIAGSGIAMHLDGRMSHPSTDPMIEGNFNGDISFETLPAKIMRQLPFSLSGSLSGKTGFRFRSSDISRNGFHRAYLSGDISLHRFRMIEPDSLDLYIGNADFRLGTSDSFSAVAGRIDSLLTASFKVDTASIIIPDARLTLSGATAGFGCRNTAASADTSVINPIAGNLTLNRIDYRSLADSTTLRMRSVKCGAILRRFNGEARVPQIGLKASAQRISYADGATRMSVRDGVFDVTAHMNPPRQRTTRTQQSERRTDWRERRRDIADTEQLDIAVDHSIGELLRRWDASGRLTARSGRLVTPYFPLRNRISDLDMTFTTDSVSLNSLRLTSGASDMNLSGNISNIRRALTSRYGSPLKLRFNIDSDTLNINEFTRALFIGASFDEESGSRLAMFGDDADDDRMQRDIEATASDTMSALLIPTNIDAELNLNARNILYSDVLFNSLNGSVLVYNGGVSLNDLTAHTDIGSLDLTALYSARTKRDISFGFSLGVRDFNIERFTRLMPAIDSLLPLMRDFKGIINADVAATTDVDSLMNIELPTLSAAIKLSGDSLVVLDRDTYRTLSKWLLFKNKNHNMIDHMEVELMISDSQIEFYPFIFDMDRYRLGVMGHNDLALNLNYHISVLKSPIPFRFGINVTGNADKMHIRLGRARFKENMVSERTPIVENTRINLMNEIETVFRRGVNAARLGPLSMKRPDTLADPDMGADTLSHADSLIFANEGLIEMPADTVAPAPLVTTDKKKKKK